MKTLFEFLYKGHASKNNKVAKIAISFPTLTKINDYEFKISGHRPIYVEDKPIVVYVDRYRGHRLHIASFEDMISTIGVHLDDYEDFSERDIIAYFDTFKEAANYIKNCGKRYCDKKYFIQSCLDDEEDNWPPDRPSDIKCTETIEYAAHDFCPNVK